MFFCLFLLILVDAGGGRWWSTEVGSVRRRSAVGYLLWSTALVDGCGGRWCRRWRRRDCGRERVDGVITVIFHILISMDFEIPPLGVCKVGFGSGSGWKFGYPNNFGLRISDPMADRIISGWFGFGMIRVGSGWDRKTEKTMHCFFPLFQPCNSVTCTKLSSNQIPNKQSKTLISLTSNNYQPLQRYNCHSSIVLCEKKKAGVVYMGCHA